jgi:2,4-dienoyl-CoA reductase-like NADH-dependent reductase (Old Yellow Enzyme family)
MRRSTCISGYATRRDHHYESRHDGYQGSHCAVIYDRLGTLLQVVGVVVSATPPELCVGVRISLASNSSRNREVRFRMQMLGEMFHGAGNR